METSRALSPADVEAAFDAALRSWADERRAAADAFARTRFGLSGALRLHRHAVGCDLYRAPANTALGVAALARLGVCAMADRVGARSFSTCLRRARLFLETDVGRAVERSLMVDFLGLPHGGDVEDALWTRLLETPPLAAALEASVAALADRVSDPEARARVAEAIAAYVDERAAAGEITANLMVVAAGYAAFHKLTPGAIAVTGPAASAIASHLAVQSFWAGPWAGAVWQMVAPAAASPALKGVVFLGAMAPAAVAATFAGVLVDPLLTRVGVHRRRLIRLTDAIEAALLAAPQGGYNARSIYLARVFDLLDIAQAAARAARP